MLINLNNQKTGYKNNSKFDVAIVGAGAAGITLATKISSKGKKVAIIEAGDQNFTEESQEIYSAKTIGDPYFDLSVARLRFFGGSTNHWAGWCRTFDKVDFDRGYLGEEFKWPIEWEDLNNYKQSACDILEISSKFNDFTIENSKIKKIDFNFSPPVNFKDKYFKDLIKNQNVQVFLNTNLTDVELNNNKIVKLILNSYRGLETKIVADKFIFAMGGIENSRYLLWFRKKYGSNFISNTEALGRYWMEHPHFTLGQAIFNKNKILESNYYSLTPQTQKDNSILNCGFKIKYISESSTRSLVREILCLAPKLGQSLLKFANKDLICGALLNAAWEQAPNYENKITLDKRFDKFGIPKPILHWKKKPIDRKTITQSIFEFNKWLNDIDGGRLQLMDWIVNEKDYPEDDLLAGYHHMGGTRMHNSLRYGVVDSNCKVYGSNNLYIAGSSLFTTGGHNNPTLPIVQLALRLADHLSS